MKVLSSITSLVLLPAVCALAAAASDVFDLGGEIESLWPENAMPLAAAHQTTPRLEWCPPPAKPVGTCVILVSGGSYQCLNDIGVVRSANERFTALGCQCVNLVYRTPRPKGDGPIYATARTDILRAIRLARSGAARRGYSPDRIGLLGMSAGAHLALVAALGSRTNVYEAVDRVDELSARPDFVIAGSPAYLLDDGLAVFTFEDNPPPVCLTHGGDDPFSPLGSTALYRALRSRKIPAELHLYGGYGHTFLGLERGVEFLRQLGFLGEVPPEEDRRVFTGNHLWVRDAAHPRETMSRTFTDENGKTAKLTWYVPYTLKTRSAMLVFPGGSYINCDPRGEALPVAEYLTRKGMTAVVLEYRIPRAEGRTRHARAWEDARWAIETMKREAPSLGLDPERVGVMGFSAGGHLALMCATSAGDAAHAVRLAVPIYSGYVVDDQGGKVYLPDGNGPDAKITGDFAFDRFTPPMCFVHGDADVISPMGSVLVWEKLTEMGIKCDLHTLATRSHCFQFKASPGTGSYTYLDRVWDFLIAQGFAL